MRLCGLLAALGGIVLARATPLKQLPFAPASLAAHPIGVPWQEVVAIPQIDKWALNPSGDAAVIRTYTIDVGSNTKSYDLHLLAINAQFTVPSVKIGPADQAALYTFLDDSHLATLSPGERQGSWQVAVQTLNYTSAPPAFPPSLSEPQVISTVELGSAPTALVYARDVKVLAIAASSATSSSIEESLKLFKVAEDGFSATAWHGCLTDEPLAIQEIVASGSKLAIVGHNDSIRPWNSTRSVLYTVDLSKHGKLEQISRGHGGGIFSPDFSSDDKLAWLEQREDGNARSQRMLWVADGDQSWEIALAWDLSPVEVVWSKNGAAINLLTLYEQEMAYYHLWTPKPDDSPVKPTRIPSHSTIHEGKHIGITPLQHSHFIAVKSSLTMARELWVVSHSPFDDPTDNFEEIRLTFFSQPTLQGKNVSAGERIDFINDVGTAIKGRVFLPPNAKNAPVIFYLHGDEDGGGWHDWWMAYMNPNTFLAAGYAVIQINPTGAEGYGDAFIQARRHQWGNQTITDLRLGLEHCLSRYPLDKTNMTAMAYGAYGGFAVHWMQGHNDDFGFSKFVIHNGIFSPRWWAAESAEPSRANWEFGPVSYAADSPLSVQLLSPATEFNVCGRRLTSSSLWDPEQHVVKFSAPELLIHDGADDGDTGPLSQSVAALQALHSRGLKAELLRSGSLVEWHQAIADALAW